MGYEQISPVPPLTPSTKWLIIITSVLYFVDFVLQHLGFQISGYNLNEIFGLVPILVKEETWLWQFGTYLFMHGHPLHLLLNMLILWYFGAEIELRMGSWRFIRFYFACGVGAGIFNYGINIIFSDPLKLSHPIIGASGAIFGILAAYAIFFGNRYFLVFFLFPMKAKYFVLIIAGIELIMGVESNAHDNVAHFAHIGGMIVGALYVYYRYFKKPFFKRSKDAERERLRKQFTLIINDDEKEKKDPPYWN